jgi:hypothetical protein
MRAQVEAAGAEPQRVFRLEGQVKMPNWAKACGWSTTDDAMLLLGIYWCAAA